jgi:hypothetical protein
MDPARPTRKLLDWKPMGTRPVGKPRQRWEEDVMEDLKKFKFKNKKETTEDRRTWRDLTEKTKTHKGFFLCIIYCLLHYFNTLVILQAHYLLDI